MSVLRALAINTFLSLVFIFCLLRSTQTETLKTTTSTTLRPTVRAKGLSLPLRNSHPAKCMREVPAVFFQYEKEVPIVGNSTINPYYNVIEVCCEGYKRYEYDWSKCVPDCGDKCQHNGFCLAGGVCKCFDDFVLNYRNECIPTCPLGCPNGQCFLNGTCLCNRGFELDATKKMCVPHCEFGCGHNEICAATNTCICAEGYSKSVRLDSTMGCQPLCIPDCGYGHCVGPNQCECFHGYVKRLNSSVCESRCYMDCYNGFCVNQTTCACHNGYRYDQNTTSCLPDCGDDCENGVCISPGVCRCFNGYVRNGTRCAAVCERGCGFYGKCIAPDVCGCALVNGPFKSYQHCKLGYCTSQGRCRCQQGTTRFLNQCLSPDKVTTYATMRHLRLNETFIAEFNLLIGQHFFLGGEMPRYY